MNNPNSTDKGIETGDHIDTITHTERQSPTNAQWSSTNTLVTFPISNVRQTSSLPTFHARVPERRSHLAIQEHASSDETPTEEDLDMNNDIYETEGLSREDGEISHEDTNDVDNEMKGSSEFLSDE